jgi:hypothetical protein
MSNIDKINELIQKAHDVRQGTTSLYRSFQEQFVEDRQKISFNRQYSDEGKRVLIEHLRKQKGVELLQLARSQRGLYDTYIADAKKLADKLAFAKPSKVDPVKAERFSKRLAEVKTEILLSTSAKSAKEKLEAFIATIDEHAFADTVKDQFAELVTPILATAGDDGGRYRLELSQMFDGVRKGTMTPEAQEAAGLLESTEALAQSTIFIPLVEEKIKEHIGREAATYINRPDEYFAEHPEDDKPISRLRTHEEILMEELAKN